MSKRNSIILGALGLILLVGIPLTVFLVRQEQDVRSRAQTPPADSCPVPAAVTGVKVEFPSEEGDIVSFDNASCSWNAVASATSYKIKVTEVDSSRVVRNDSVGASTARITFPVTSGKTYQCDVAAINSCGSTGPAGSHSLLCEIEGQAPTATPVVPTTPVLPTTPILPTTPPAKSVPLLSCGASGCSSVQPCAAGLVCVETKAGKAFCAMPQFQTNCQQNPSQTSCCSVPVSSPVPTIPPTGDTGSMMVFGASSLAVVIIGGILFMLSGL